MPDKMVIVMPKRHPKIRDAHKERKPLGVQVRGTEEWKEWIEKAAVHCRMSVSALVDISVAKFVKEQGFSEPPPER